VKDVFDDDLDNHLEEKEFECNECGTPIETWGYCSRDCYKASLL